MASKKLNTEGFGTRAGAPAASAPPSGTGRSVVDLLVEHNRAVAAGAFEPGAATREASLEAWERFFEIGARAQELPAWAVKPELAESGGRLAPTAGGADRSAFGAAQGRTELRQAVDVMRSGNPQPNRLSREAMVRMARSSFSESVFGGTGPAGPGGPSR